MKINYCEQRTDEWFKAKWGSMGGSTAKDLMVPSKKANETSVFYSLLQQLTEDIDLEKCNEWIGADAARGIEMEPYACMELELWLKNNKNYSSDFQWSEVGLIERCCKYFKLSPDRVDIELGKKIACEVKCPNGKTHMKWIAESDVDPIPMEHVWQAISYFTLIEGLETLYWASYRPENKFKPLYIVELNKDSMINVGTTKRPVNLKMEEAVEVLLSKYNELEKAIDEQLKRIN